MWSFFFLVVHKQWQIAVFSLSSFRYYCIELGSFVFRVSCSFYVLFLISLFLLSFFSTELKPRQGQCYVGKIRATLCSNVRRWQHASHNSGQELFLFLRRRSKVLMHLPRHTYLGAIQSEIVRTCGKPLIKLI